MARSKKACIVFFDEVDAIGGARFDDGAGGDNEVQRTMLEIVNQLDGFDARGNIKVLMATNRPDTLDPALLRPGRLDRKIEFGLPDLKARTQIFKIHTKCDLLTPCARPIRTDHHVQDTRFRGRTSSWVCARARGARHRCMRIRGRLGPAHAANSQRLREHTCRTMNCERDIRFELLARLCPNSTGADIRSVCTEAGMFAIRARRKTVTEKDFLDAVQKVIKGYQKFSATPKSMVYN
jgi:ATP-dependent 26S proteasome regulatory subunit